MLGVTAAIALTECDLATAGQTPPLECLGIQPSQQTGTDASSTSPCVSALSRSPQHWSTYSGYLREIPMLCFAIKRQMEVDVVKEVYANISQEKIALLKVLNRGAEGAVQRAQDQEVKLANFVDYLKAAMNELNQGLVASVSSVRMASQDISELAQSSRASEELEAAAGSIVSLAQERIQEAALQTSRAMEVHLSKSLDHLLAALVAGQSVALANSTTQFASQLDITLDNVQHRFDIVGKQLHESLGPVKELASVAPQSHRMMEEVWALFRRIVDSASPVLLRFDELSNLQNALAQREQARAANMSALLDRIEVAHTDELGLYAIREAERLRASTRPRGMMDLMASLLFGDAAFPQGDGERSISQLGSIGKWHPSLIGQILRALPISSSASTLLLRGGLITLVILIKVVWSALCLMLVSAVIH